ncbi:MAG: type II toxin-antitoxin system HicB family antitoxin [bacterium]|nr:type II toxin-antitoxin system HicB family antitoxin [bacterium]
MNTLEEYMKLPYPIEITPDKDEGGYVASHPDLKGCITCGQTIESATAALVDAKRAWLEVALENGYEIPVPNNSDLHTLKSDETLLSVSKQILDKNRQAYEKLSKS